MQQWNELAKIEKPEAAPTDSSADSPQNLPLSPNEKYEYLTEYGTQILCLLTVESGCIYLSPNFEMLTGVKAEQRMGKKFYGMIHADWRERLKERLNPRGSEEPPYAFRCKMQHADKKWYWYLFQIHPKQQSDATEYICIVENIHDSMLTQNTLQKARLEAELALRARSEFLANMSHELRTPLNAVIGFSQIIESEMFGKIENPQYLEYVKHIQESGYDLLAKIEDLLEIANIDAGRVALTREEVLVADILKHVLEAQAHHAHSAQVTLLTPPPAADILLYVDRLKLQHILGHLVANAIKFSSKGSCITIEAEKNDKGQLLLSVNDNGSGMSEEKLGDIVTALKEENCWSAKNNRSIGLGLALTREFVALHGGQVNIISKEGQGTTIQISLPRDCICATTVKTPDYLRQVAN